MAVVVLLLGCSAGGGGPRWGYRAGDWADLTDNLQAQVRRTRLRIPIVHGLDAVHGHNNVYGATIFPHHVGMGATRNPQLMLRIARSVAKVLYHRIQYSSMVTQKMGPPGAPSSCSESPAAWAKVPYHRIQYSRGYT